MKRRSVVSWWTRGTLLFAMIGFFNFVALRQNLMDLSLSVHWLTGWWHYGTTRLFLWLHIDIPPLVQDCWIILSMAIAGANLHLYSNYGLTLFSILFSKRDQQNEAWQSWSDHLDRFWFESEGEVAAGVLIVCALGWVLVVAMPLVVLLLVLNALLAVIVGSLTMWEIESGVRPGPLRDDTLVSVLVFPLLIVFVLFQTLASLPGVLAKSVGVVVLMLGLNLLFTHLIDPLEPLLRQLPQPPQIATR